MPLRPKKKLYLWIALSTDILIYMLLVFVAFPWKLDQVVQTNPILLHMQTSKSNLIRAWFYIIHSSTQNQQLTSKSNQIRNGFHKSYSSTHVNIKIKSDQNWVPQILFFYTFKHHNQIRFGLGSINPILLHMQTS